MTLRSDGSFTSGEIESVRLVGPIAPATKRGLLGRARRVLGGQPHRELGGALVQLVHAGLGAVVGLRDPGRAEGVGLDDVGARLEVGACTSSTTSGRVSTRISLSPFRSRGWSRKRSPRKSASPSGTRLEHGAHGAVDHEDPLGEQAIELASDGTRLHGSLVAGAGLGAGDSTSLS